MKTTLELYNLNPQDFKTLLYPEVLELKRVEMQTRYDAAVTEMFATGFGNLTQAQKNRKDELDKIVAEATKALAYIKLWIEEMR